MTRSSTRLYVEEKGSGRDVVVLLHGLVGSCRFWTPVVGCLDVGRRYVAPDLLGFGRSPWPDIDYTADVHIEALQRDVLARVDGPFHLVGHSTGALLALELSARAPERVRSLTLLALPAFESEEQARAEMTRASRWAWLMIRMRGVARLLCSCICQRRAFWQHVLPWFLRRLPRDVVVDGMMHSFRSISSTLDECILRQRSNETTRAVLAGDVPLTNIFDERDELIPLVRARAYAERHQRAAHLSLSAGGHQFPLLAPETTASLLEAAFRRGRSHG